MRGSIAFDEHLGLGQAFWLSGLAIVNAAGRERRRPFHPDATGCWASGRWRRRFVATTGPNLMIQFRMVS